MWFVLTAAVTALACPVPTGGVPLDVQYLDHRWIALVRQSESSPLRFYLDTGGGANMFFASAARRLGLPVAHDSAAPPGAGTVAAASIARPASFPPFSAIDDAAASLLVPPPNPMMETESDGPLDGFLGRLFFAERIWTFDYPGHTLRLLAPDAAARIPDHCWQALHFQVDSSGRRTTHFPRLTVVVAGDTLQMLFDTGAMTQLTDSARTALGDGSPARRGTSFIRQGIADRWRARHPEWHVIEGAEQGTRATMIRVPTVTIGAEPVGPVWFTVRPDPNFQQFMAQWMDRPLDGAIGGSALQSLVVTVDYPRALASVVRPEAGVVPGPRNAGERPPTGGGSGPMGRKAP